MSFAVEMFCKNNVKYQTTYRYKDILFSMVIFGDVKTLNYFLQLITFMEKMYVKRTEFMAGDI